MPLAANLLSTVTNAVAGSGIVQGVVFSSQVTPEITLYDPNAAPGQPGAPTAPGSSPSWIGGFVRPTLTINTAAGPFQVAPYGAPAANYFWITILAGVVFVVGTVVAVGWVARKIK